MQDEIVSLLGIGWSWKPSRSSQENPRSDFLPGTRTRPRSRSDVSTRGAGISRKAKGKSSAESRDRPGQIQPIQILFIRNAVSFFFLPFCSVDLNKFSLPFKKKRTDFPLGLCGWVTYDAIPFVPPAPGRDRQAEAKRCTCETYRHLVSPRACEETHGEN